MRVALFALLVSLGLTLAPAHAEQACGPTFCINWSGYSGGTTVEATSAEGAFKVSGSIASWDASTGQELTSATWQVTGGFWAAFLEESDVLFRDSFEGRRTDQQQEGPVAGKSMRPPDT